MLTTPNLVLHYLHYIPDAPLPADPSEREAYLKELILRKGKLFDSMAYTTYTREEVTGRVDGVDSYQIILPWAPIKRLHELCLFVGTGFLTFRFTEADVVYSDKEEIGSTLYRRIIVSRPTGRVALPLGAFELGLEKMALMPLYVSPYAPVPYPFIRRFYEGTLNVRVKATVGYSLEDPPDDPLKLHPPMDVQEAVALLCAIELAEIASAQWGGLSTWHLGERTENYAGGGRYAMLTERWRERVKQIVETHRRIVLKVDG